MGALGAIAVLFARANEILVLAAGAFGAGIHQSQPALAAEDAAPEVVEMAPRLFAPRSLLAEEVLNLLKRLVIDQMIVASLIGFSGIFDRADVIGIAQQRL
jgi:hypothetical protein